VHDEGAGLSGPELQRLGTPYFTTKDHGTGLGVVIAMAAVRQHGGDLKFESTHGRGTRVQIELPTNVGEEQADATCAGGG
jgi:signal transduction histidine kinase